MSTELQSEFDVILSEQDYINLKNITSLYEKQKQKTNALNKHLNQVQKRSQAKDLEAYSLIRKVMKLSRRVIVLQDEITSQQLQYQQLRGRWIEQQNEIKNLTQQNNTLTQSLNKLNQYVSQLQSQKNKMNQQINNQIETIRRENSKDQILATKIYGLFNQLTELINQTIHKQQSQKENRQSRGFLNKLEKSQVTLIEDQLDLTFISQSLEYLTNRVEALLKYMGQIKYLSQMSIKLQQKIQNENKLFREGTQDQKSIRQIIKSKYQLIKNSTEDKQTMINQIQQITKNYHQMIDEGYAQILSQVFDHNP